jgi:hypothetical protein
VILIVVITFFFDLLDLGSEERIKRFSFVYSTNYIIYLVFRVFFGIGAALIITSTGAIEDPLLLSIVSVFSSVSILQNFSLRMGEENPVNFQDFFKRYRAKMIKVVVDRYNQKIEKETKHIAEELATVKTTEELEGILKTIFIVLKRDMGLEQQKEWLDNYFTFVNEICSGNEDVKKNILATDIVFYDRVRAESIITLCRMTE